MSQGPSRPFTTSHSYSTAMPLAAAYTRHTQQQQPAQRALYQHNVTSHSSSPTIRNGDDLGRSGPADNVSIVSTESDSAFVRRGRVGRHQGPSAQQENLYCDSCQTFRNVRAFKEPDSQYNVCNFCQSRDQQKRKHQLERFEMYEEQQQRSLKQARYQQQQQIQYPSTNTANTGLHISPQLQQQQQEQQQSTAPITLNSDEDHRPPSLSSHALPPPSAMQSYSTLTKTTNSPQLKQASRNMAGNMARASPTLLSNNNLSSNVFAATSNIRQLEGHLDQQQQQKPQVMQPAISLPLPPYQTTPFQPQQQQPPTHMQQYMLPSSSMIKQDNNMFHKLDLKTEMISEHEVSSQPQQSIDDAVTPSMALPSSSSSSIKSSLTSSPIATSSSMHTHYINDVQQQQQPDSAMASAPLANSTTHHRLTPSAADRASQDLISLEAFVKELKKETDFDRKHYHLDIRVLIDKLGDAFTQIGRAICERVLEGTKFNFSLKDRRRSTKSPDTLSTLRYYCSQRVDTAKPRKGDHPKAQCRYDCGGALTIIIDLLKRSAHVTVIHKCSHPPFVSQHGQQAQKKSERKNKEKLTTLQQQQPQNQTHYSPASPTNMHQQQQHQQQPQYEQPIQYSPAIKPIQQQLNHSSYHSQAPDFSTSASTSSTSTTATTTSYELHQQQLEVQRQQHLYLQKQQVEREFELLRQQVADIGELLASQQRFGNKEFLQTAKDALASANELLDACKAHESSNSGLQLNKYTVHYNKSGYTEP